MCARRSEWLETYKPMMGKVTMWNDSECEVLEIVTVGLRSFNEPKILTMYYISNFYWNLISLGVIVEGGCFFDVTGC